MPAVDTIKTTSLGMGRAAVFSSQPDRAAEAALQCFNPWRLSGWDSILAKHPQASFFHSAAWAAVLESTYGYTPKYFAAIERGAFVSLMPMMEVNSWLTGRRGVALPFTDDCEPLCAGADSFKRIFDSAIALGRQRGWKYVEFRGGRKWLDGAPASLSFHGHELDLTGREEQLFQRVEGSVRRAIRKAEKEGVTVEMSHSIESVRAFYDLLCQTRRKHGLPPQPFSFFQQIYRNVISRDMGLVVLASHQGRPIAGGMYFKLGKRAVYKFGASDETQQHLRGNNLVMWAAIRWHARNGCESLHLGRTSLGNEGLRRFKLSWGAVEQPIEYVKYDLRRNEFVTDIDGVTGWHNEVFRRLPLSLSRYIGSKIYKHWA